MGVAAFILLTGLGVAPARALIGANDVVPAATLLLPYFEVEVTGQPNDRRDTAVTIINTSPAAALAHVVLWTDYGVPTHTEDVFLTGFDVETVSLAGLLIDAGGAVIAAHRGQPSQLFGGLCAGFDYGDALARGYVTIDNVNQESDLVPGDTGYFEFDGTGIANNTNQFWGHYINFEPGREVLESGPLVHVEAQDDPPLPVTFYARDTNFGSADQRERLATTWGTRYWNGLTDMVCWRDDVRLEPFPCPNQSAAPLTARGQVTVTPLELIVFDHAENSTIPDVLVEPCRLAAGRVRVGGPLFPVSAKTGWIFANVDPETAPELAPRGFIVPPIQGFFGSLHTLHLDGLGVGVGGVGLDTILGGAAAVPQGGGR
jgi:hypothetical protein